MPHIWDEQNNYFPVFLARFDLSRFCFLGFILAQREIYPFFSLTLTLTHFSSHSSLVKVTVDQSNHWISLRSLCSADEPHQSWPKQFSTRNLGRHTWISIFSCCYVCFCSIKFSCFSGRVFFCSTYTYTSITSVGSAASFDPDFSFLQSDFTL